MNVARLLSTCRVILAMWWMFLRITGRKGFLTMAGRHTLGWLLSRTNRPPATLVADKEWDYLIVLDACRYDAFRAVYGNVRYIHSPGTWTGKWVEGNFVDNPSPALKDITVIASNPHLSPWYFELRHWGEYPFQEFIDSWDDDNRLAVTAPSRVVEDALSFVDEHPNRRLIIHFMQPHVPWIPYVLRHPELFPQPYEDLSWWITWDKVNKGEIPMREAREAYMENLYLVLHSVNRLLENLKGHAVITSDHGDLFGEGGLTGHPLGVYVPELTKVPWLEVDAPCSLNIRPGVGDWK